MTDLAVISIITTTIIVMGLTIIGVQVTLFLYLLRRTDAISDRLNAMQKEFSQEFRQVRKEISAVVERVARLEGIIVGRQEVGNGVVQTGDD